jgi:hypothetical protein
MKRWESNQEKGTFFKKIYTKDHKSEGRGANAPLLSLDLDAHKNQTRGKNKLQ